MDKMEEVILPELPQTEVVEIVEAYKNLYQNVTEIHSVRVLEHQSETSKFIISEWRQRNLEMGSMMKIQKIILVDKLFETAVDIDATEISRCLLSTFSPSGSLKVTISLEKCDNTKNNKFMLDIWNNEKLIMNFDLSKLNLHGAVYQDDTFAALTWSRQEDKIMYIAEKKTPKTVPFYSQKQLPENKLGEEEFDPPLMGEQFTYEDDWGEQLSPKKSSTIVTFNIHRKKFQLIDEFMDNKFSPGQVVWEPNGMGIVGVGFFHEPRRLGIKFCTNRPSCIFYTTDGYKNYVILSRESMSVSSPRFSPDGKYIVWLQHPQGGPHNSAYALIKCDWETKNIATVIDIVPCLTWTKNNFKFRGIYCSNLPIRCWTSDSKFIIFSTQQEYCIVPFAVNIDDKTLWCIGPNNDYESTAVLDVTENNFAVGRRTSFKQSSVLAAFDIMAVFSEALSENSNFFSWNYLTRPTNLDKINIISPFTVGRESSSEESCYAFYYGCENEKANSVPVVLFIHGGPHSSVSSIYYPSLHFFTLHGFGVVIVNYRGSLGCGNGYVHSLLGNIGSVDVSDCYLALKTAFEKFPWLDSKNVMLYGGSHGGFLVTHLSSRYPNDFKSVVTRNPAVNIPAKVFLSDIPDWNLVELGFPYNGIAEIMSNENLWKEMTKRSPMYFVKNVKTPTLLLLGKKDIRIPYFPGLSYYNALKELKIPTRALLYDDHHSLSSVSVEIDHIINTLIWFKRCMKNRNTF